MKKHYSDDDIAFEVGKYSLGAEFTLINMVEQLRAERDEARAEVQGWIARLSEARAQLKAATEVQSGGHLRVVREFIQHRAFNGSDVTWGSPDVLRFGSVSVDNHFYQPGETW